MLSFMSNSTTKDYYREKSFQLIHISCINNHCIYKQNVLQVVTVIAAHLLAMFLFPTAVGWLTGRAPGL